jgi:uncharacterized protein CbrC (UPF0167 family)
MLTITNNNDSRAQKPFGKMCGFNVSLTYKLTFFDAFPIQLFTWVVRDGSESEEFAIKYSQTIHGITHKITDRFLKFICGFGAN